MDEEPHRYSWPLLTFKSFTLSTFCHFRSFPLSVLFSPLTLSLCVSWTESRASCHVSAVWVYVWIMCGPCDPGCVHARARQCVWSNHCNRSHGLHPSLPMPISLSLPPTLSLSLLSTSFAPHILSCLSFFLSITYSLFSSSIYSLRFSSFLMPHPTFNVQAWWNYHLTGFLHYLHCPILSD